MPGPAMALADAPAGSMPTPAGGSGAPSFGLLLGGVRVVLPAGVPVVYLSDVAIHPLAGAPGRVLGLMQLQGHPVVVLEAALSPPAGPPAVRRRAVLVLGATGDCAALRVDEAPAPIALGAAVTGIAAPSCAFAQVLDSPVADAADASRVWWHFVPARLFEVLAAQSEAPR